MALTSVCGSDWGQRSASYTDSFGVVLSWPLSTSSLPGGPGSLRASSGSVVRSQMESICFTWKCLGVSPGGVSVQPTPPPSGRSLFFCGRLSCRSGNILSGVSLSTHSEGPATWRWRILDAWHCSLCTTFSGGEAGSS